MKFLPACRRRARPELALVPACPPPPLPNVNGRFDLGGLVIVVTRPRPQGEATARLLRRHGAETLQLPVLDIAALHREMAADRFDPARIAHADAFIFVSANAVQFGMPLIDVWGGPARRSRIFAIGQATAQALAARGFEIVLCPDTGNDSEALLAMPQLQNVRGQHIVLVRGRSESGGRALLANTLIARGALLWPLECYQRRPVQALPVEKIELSSRLQMRAVHGVLVLSVETLDSLRANIESMPHRRDVMLLASHPRIAAAAKAQGFKRVEVVPMGDDALPLALHQLKPMLLSYPAEWPEQT